MLLQSKLGFLCLSSAETKQKGVASFFNPSLDSIFLEADPKGRWICAEIQINQKKNLVIGIYTQWNIPNEMSSEINNTAERENFFQNLISMLQKYNNETLILIEEFNAVCDPQLERKRLNGLSH